MNFESLPLDPVALAIGPIIIRWYSLAYLAGFIIGWKYCLRLVSKAPDMRPNAQDIDNFITWAVIGVILGGRIGYILFYQLDFYLSSPLEVLKIWKGGMSFHGGVAGVLIAMYIFSRKHKIPLLRLSDVICAAAPIGLFFGRIANFINAELYGRATNLPWGIKFPGTNEPRHPSQLYEALLEGLVLFIILYILMKRPNIKAGMVSGAFLAGYGVFRALIEIVREPDIQIGLIGGFISMGQILSLPMIIIGIALMIFVSRSQANGK